LTGRRQAEEQARRLLQEEAARRVAEDASRAVEEQRERLRTTLASIGDAVIATDTEGRITNLNAVAESLTGWTSGEAAGQPLERVFRIVNERTRRPVENPATRALREGVIVGLANHTVLIARDGTERPIDDSAAPIRCKEGEVVGCVLVFRDVTERREAERRLQRSEERYRALVTATAQMVWTTDPDGLVVEDSPSWRAFTGQTYEQWRGRGWLDALHPDDRERAAAAWGRAVSGRTAYTVDYRVRRHDGEYRWTAVRGVPVPNDDGTIREWVGTNTDVTDLKRAEEAAAERSRITALRADVSTAFAAAQPVRESLQGCCEALVAHLGAAFARIWTHDEAGGMLVLQASAGQYTHLDGPHGRVKVGEFKIGRIAASRRPHLSNDVPNDPQVSDREWASREGMVAFVGYPLLVEDRVVGVVAMFARRPLTDAILSDLAPLADQIAQHVHRKHAEERLRESELRYRLVGQAANDAIWDWDLVTNRVVWNEGVQARFGYTLEQIAADASWWVEHIHPDDRDRIDRGIHAAIDSGGESWQDEYRFRRADGSYAEVFDRGRVVRDGGRPVRMAGSMLDLTERKRAERTARFLAEASAALVDLTDYESTLQKVASLAVPTFADWCAVDMVDEAGGRRRVAVTHADPSKVRLAKEVEGRFPPRPDAPHGIDRVLRTGEPELVEDIPDALLAAVAHDEEHLRTLRELGLRSYVCVPIRSLGRTLGGITFVADQPGRRYDAADLRVAQDLASRAAVAIQNASLYRALKESDRRKDEFLATLAHELRNPLAPLRNALQIMKLSGEQPAREQARTLMERQLEQMVRLVDDLMDVSRISRNKLELRRERVELARVVESAVETSRPLVEQQGHRLTVTLPPGPVFLDADLTRLAQVFLNLLNNSAKYTEPGGRIWLTAERQGSDVVVAVKDTGIGIPRDKLPGVFELFSQVEGTLTRAQGGLGIGLSLVRRLVEMHGGSITAHSEGPGRGSTFTVRLPVLVEAPRPTQADERREEAAPTSALRILIVDDNRDSADSLGMMLRLMGNDIQTAYDGVEAVAAAESSRPHVVLLDIGLPRQNGYEACRRIREQPWGKGMVLIALTGWGQEEDVRRSHEAGFDHHMVKPVDPNVLMKLLAELQSVKR
jgi:PAS domain S-box-containing protein